MQVSCMLLMLCVFCLICLYVAHINCNMLEQDVKNRESTCNDNIKDNNSIYYHNKCKHKSSYFNNTFNISNSYCHYIAIFNTVDISL